MNSLPLSLVAALRVLGSAVRAAVSMSVISSAF
jgi:hypothetical protein